MISVVVAAFGRGLKGARALWLPIVLMTAIHLGLALGALGPLVGRIDARTEFANPSGRVSRLDVRMFDDVATLEEARLRDAPALVAAVAVAALLLQTFFWGGVLAAFRDAEGDEGARFEAAAFFGGAGGWFFPFLRVALVVLGLLAGLNYLGNGLLVPALEKAAKARDSEWFALVGRVSVQGVLVLFAGLTLLLADYTRVVGFAGRRRSMAAAFVRAVPLVWRARGSLGVFVGSMLLHAAVLVAGFALHRLLGGFESAAGIVLWLVAGQAILGMRHAARVASIGAVTYVVESREEG